MKISLFFIALFLLSSDFSSSNIGFKACAFTVKKSLLTQPYVRLRDLCFFLLPRDQIPQPYTRLETRLSQ